MNKPVRNFRASIWFGRLLAVLAIGVCVVISNRMARPDVQTLRLRDGACQIRELSNDLTIRMQVESESSEFDFRLAGIQVATSPAARSYLQQLINDDQLHVRFDRQRFDDQNRVLGYLYSGETSINVELITLGLARPDPIQGNSASQQRQYEKAYQARLDAEGSETIRR